MTSDVPAAAGAAVTVRPAMAPATIGTEAGANIRVAVEVDQIARVLLAATLDTPDSVWLIKDRGARLSVFAVFWPAVVHHGLAHGHVDVAVDGVGATLAAGIWLDPTAEGHDAYRQLLTGLCGEHADRFGQYEAARTVAQPPAGSGRRSLRLAWLAVARRWQGQGIGTALLRHRHAVLDRHGVSAYLTSTSSGFRDLAVRHGYRPAAPTVVLPDGGPSLWRMLRRPPPLTTEPRDHDIAHSADADQVGAADPGS